MERIALWVTALFSETGEVVPLCVACGEGKFAVDRVISKRRYCPNVSCVAPIEYTVQMRGLEKKLYFEPSTGQWFGVRHG